MSRIGRVLSSSSQYSLCRRIVIDGIKTKLRLNHIRTLCLTSHCLAKSKKPADEDDEEISQPIKFSSSKASHKTWNVDQSLGSKYQRPWWKVLPISLLGVSFLLWCALRGETVIDEQLEKNLYEQLPGLLSDEEQSKSR
ncbi:ubiquinol-cytochrome c reductase complex assembly factor 4 [Oncorhynchus clarkii lewisi]|uniref:ubiquinol-cytochrome c reductase complex assembly factor 4 n=1 Tax=Oncorhynchus clarkii lewisi TaxID=490388 RepID=UPI0039B8E1F2